MARFQPIAVRERDAAQMLQVRVEDFRVWAANVELKPCLVNGETRYRVSDIEARLAGVSDDPGDRY